MCFELYGWVSIIFDGLEDMNALYLLEDFVDDEMVVLQTGRSSGTHDRQV